MCSFYRVNIANYEIVDNYIIFNIPDIEISNNLKLIIGIFAKELDLPLKIKLKINGCYYNVLTSCNRFLYLEQLCNCHLYILCYEPYYDVFICNCKYLKGIKNGCVEKCIINEAHVNYNNTTYKSNQVVSVLLKSW